MSDYKRPVKYRARIARDTRNSTCDMRERRVNNATPRTTCANSETMHTNIATTARAIRVNNV
jgi:hypothetical protein